MSASKYENDSEISGSVIIKRTKNNTNFIMIKKYVSWIIIDYLRLAIITICNASIIAIDATTGKSNALSWDEPSSIFPTESDINTTLSSRF